MMSREQQQKGRRARRRRRSLRACVAGCALVGVWWTLTGFAPFHSGGLARFTVQDGQGATVGEDASKAVAVEADALFHTLSSRFGGGGVLMYAEFPGRDVGFAGLLVIDLRHAGLPDLSQSIVALPDARRAELFYQEWDGSGDLFRGDSVSGTITVRDMFRGEEQSAVALAYDLTFLDHGLDGERGTEDDQWRRVTGSATTSPTVDAAVARENATSYRSRTRENQYAPDGDINVNCIGSVEVEEEEYDETSYTYEDDSSCEGDTWEDDAEEPQDESGCSGKQASDEGSADPDGGCDGSGTDDLEDPDEEDEEDGDTYYGDGYGNSGTSDSGGCEGDSSDSGDSSDDGGCDGDSDTDTGSDTSTDESDDDDSGPECSGDDDDDDENFAVASGIYAPSGSTRALRRYLREVASDRPMRRADGARIVRARRPEGRFGKDTWRTMRRLLGYLPFVIVGVVIRAWRRRYTSAWR